MYVIMPLLPPLSSVLCGGEGGGEGGFSVPSLWPELPSGTILYDIRSIDYLFVNRTENSGQLDTTESVLKMTIFLIENSVNGKCLLLRKMDTHMIFIVQF
jgi:hypothetical protein